MILLAGGPGLSNAMMQPIADHLKDRFRCVMLEQRGTGRSILSRYDAKTISYDAYMADIEAVRESLGQRRIILIGNSWGMMLSLAYAGHYPQRTLAVATMGSGPLTLEQAATMRDNVEYRMTKEIREAAARTSSGSPDERLTSSALAMRPYLYDQAAARRLMSIPHVGDANTEVSAAAGGIFSDLETQVFQTLVKVSCPVLVVQGRQDVAPEEVAFTVGDRVRNAKIVLLSRCGHAPWIEQPDQAWKALDAFLGPFAAVVLERGGSHKVASARRFPR